MASCSFFFSAPLHTIARPRKVDVDTYQDLQAHLSTSRRQESAHAMVQPVRGECATRRHVHPMGSRSVRMPERATGGDAVADELFDLLHVRKAAALLARPDDLVIDAQLEDATGPIRAESHGAELIGKRGQYLLRHPSRPQAPAAQSSIGDLDHGADGHSFPPRTVRGCAGINMSSDKE